MKFGTENSWTYQSYNPFSTGRSVEYKIYSRVQSITFRLPLSHPLREAAQVKKENFKVDPSHSHEQTRKRAKESKAVLLFTFSSSPNFVV
jgi:hypothetical protein